MKFHVLGIFILAVLCIIPRFLAAQEEKISTLPVEQLVRTMQASTAFVQRDITKATDKRRLDVVTCLNEKLRIMRGLLTVSLRNAELYEEAQSFGNKDDSTRYQERVVYAHRRLSKLRQLADLCWSEKQRPRDETIIALRAPEFELDEMLEYDYGNDIDSNFGFPEVPPASPFE